MSGLHTALQEITLVLFTTLAPSGAIAFVLSSLPLLAQLVARLSHRSPSASEPILPAKSKPLEQALPVPILLVLVGLIASASHLGTPSNALYVLTRTGFSPLSTEVATVVIFLGLASTYWLYSFALSPRAWLKLVLLLLADLVAVASVASIALAYSVTTMITWSSPLFAIGLIALGLCGGPLVALATIQASSPASLSWHARVAFYCLCVAGLAVNVLVMAMQGARLPHIANYMTRADQLVPGYWWLFATHIALVLLGLWLCVRITHGKHRDGKHDEQSHLVLQDAADENTASLPQGVRANLMRALPCILGTTIVLAGIFVARFMFYMQHMTVGLGT